MRPVLIWPRILAVTNGILYKLKINFIITLKTIKVIVNERCTNYHTCRISVFPELSDFHISRTIEILQIWKYANFKIVEKFNSMILYVSG